ncbi:MAG: DUF3124 domain-containing protein [Myxococcales bacterium]|nr:DUF3124 domain-containing protein [Myxococcales bacterium]
MQRRRRGTSTTLSPRAWLLIAVASVGALACEAPPEPQAVVHDPPAPPTETSPAPAASEDHEQQVHKSAGQRLYVPVYATVYLGGGTEKEKDARLANRLQVRNISATRGFTLRRVDYYNTAGERLERVLKEPVELRPMETRSYTVLPEDDRAGSGGNFVVEWVAPEPVVPPIVETVNAFVHVHRAFVFLGEARLMAELDAHGEVQDAGAAR